MLVLTRRVGDSIVIADDIVVTVLEVRSDQVRLGIDAPREVAVHREEVYRQMQGMDASEPVGRSGVARRRLRDAGREREAEPSADPTPGDPSPEVGGGPEAGPPDGSPAGPQAAAGGQLTSGSAPGYENGRPREAARAPSTETTA